MPPPLKPAIAALCQELHPGSRVVRLRKLHGGQDAATHRVELDTKSGRLALILRRYSAETLAWNPQGPDRLAKTLVAVAEAALPAPRLLHADLDGRRFGTPALLMSYLPGRGDLRPQEPRRYLRDLAALLARIHAVPATLPGLAHLPQPDEQLRSWLKSAIESKRLSDDPDRDPILRVLGAAQAHPERFLRDPSLVHGDYWAGNVLARRGRLHAVVDWDNATRGDRRYDLGYCRADLSLFLGLDAAVEFLAAYEQEAGEAVDPRELAFWDLLGATRALPDAGHWLSGYHGLGRTDLQPGILGPRLRSFIRDALDRGLPGVGGTSQSRSVPKRERKS